eukprot:CAMPEP_0194335464 /NCGR_PEP_ID=MMETSP0171-20130528/69667_1 /TAXON_ID=218684 /ORGANISM="Corethron pennatum, Strain L29A3" /LENGTH=54 /DNA_ID=CAMNT_0039098563 /DNA_START=244 /DNA_END=405 /DNA_ORIENTATION=+
MIRCILATSAGRDDRVLLRSSSVPPFRPLRPLGSAFVPRRTSRVRAAPTVPAIR